MSSGTNKLNIVGSKGKWLKITDPKTYNQFLGREFVLSSQSIEQKFSTLVESKLEEMVEVVHCNKTYADRMMILIKPFDITLADLNCRAGTFRNEELINTIEEVLALLEGLRKKGREYGMLGADTICFYNGEFKLAYGEETERK